MKKTIIRRFLGGAFLLGLGASVGSASTLTYWVDMFGLGTAQTSAISINSATLVSAGGTTYTATVPKFDMTDSNPGYYYALTAVQLSLTTRFDGYFETINIYSQPIAFTNGYATAAMILHAGDSADTQVSGNVSAGPVSGTAACCNAVTSFGPYDTTISNSQLAADITSLEGFGSASFHPYVSGISMYGTGSSTDPNAAGHLFYGSDGQTAAVLKVTYSYSEVSTPEPLTSALVGGALLGLGLLVNFRRTRKAQPTPLRSKGNQELRG